MATERDFELLDDYLANRMSGAERSSFENQLQADPDLQNELSLQKSLIEGIRKSRAAELKAMLQNVPVPAPTAEGLTTGAKIALSSFVAAIVITGVYLYFDKNSASTIPTLPPTELPAGNADSNETQAAEQSEAEEQQATDQVTEGEDRKAPTKSTETKPAQPQPSIEVFDPTESDEETAVAADESPRTSSDNGGSALAVEIDKAHAEYRFHYQFRDSKLFLYGPFENNLYEIMEFINDEKTTMFLYHKNNYYLLKDDGDRIKPLTAITDPALLRKLKEYRKN